MKHEKTPIFFFSTCIKHAFFTPIEKSKRKQIELESKLVYSIANVQKVIFQTGDLDIYFRGVVKGSRRTLHFPKGVLQIC